MQLIRHIFSKNTKKAELSTAPPYLFYSTPCSTIDLATFIKPAMFAPFM